MRQYHILQQDDESGAVILWLDGGVIESSNGDAAMKKYAADRELESPILLAIPETDWNPGRVTLKKRDPVVVVERAKAQTRRSKKTAAATS